MDFNQRIEKSVEAMKERVAEIKDYMKNRFAGGQTKHAAKDYQHISALLNEILKTTDEMSVLVARSGIEDMSKVLTGLIEKAGTFGGRQSYASIVNTGHPKPSSPPVGEKTIIINKTKNSELLNHTIDFLFDRHMYTDCVTTTTTITSIPRRKSL